MTLVSKTEEAKTSFQVEFKNRVTCRNGLLSVGHTGKEKRSPYFMMGSSTGLRGFRSKGTDVVLTQIKDVR